MALIARIETFTVPLPALRPFAISGGRVDPVRVLVKVTADDGSAGWGEATPIPAWTYETTESIVSSIEGYLAPAALGRPLWDLDGLVRLFDRTLNRGYSIGMPLARAAIDVACHDALARSRGLSLGELWGQRRRDTIELAWIVTGPGSVEEGLAAGYRHFKVKVGLPGQDPFTTVRAVRQAAPEAVVWVDANQAFTADAALRLARRLEELDVAVFEQPVPANDLAGLRRLREASPVTIAVDESLRHPTDLATFVSMNAVDVVVAKVQRVGGLTLALRQLHLAEACGLAVWGSGLTESDIGLAASLHLFAAFGLGTPVDLNGRQFLASPYASGLAVEGPVAHVPAGPGLGIEVDEEWIRRAARVGP
ncbi:mandelate racemase/muconate lactonizing enzyme family protein [Nonomuraea soli]|uniref:Muconate cycloisomerase n=1 Tax=Nonomuraea soli TaxID=1032476 RepID=A0A7W0HNF4_9ACTN|nr:enolase C-terminal domain-like protein [Nonomuraea soli]MBA2889750.1 muconate cycloisomerase [Nonomuraea soli]